jgi:hypothetical protein
VFDEAILIGIVGVAAAIFLGILVAKAVSGALLRGLLVVVPFTFLGYVFCGLGTHLDPLTYFGLPFVPTALLIPRITGRYVGEPGMWPVFLLAQAVYYVLLFALLGRVGHRARG